MTSSRPLQLTKEQELTLISKYSHSLPTEIVRIELGWLKENDVLECNKFTENFGSLKFFGDTTMRTECIFQIIKDDRTIPVEYADCLIRDIVSNRNLSIVFEILELEKYFKTAQGQHSKGDCVESVIGDCAFLLRTVGEVVIAKHLRTFLDSFLELIIKVGREIYDLRNPISSSDDDNDDNNDDDKKESEEEEEYKEDRKELEMEPEEEGDEEEEDKGKRDQGNFWKTLSPKKYLIATYNRQKRKKKKKPKRSPLTQIKIPVSKPGYVFRRMKEKYAATFKEKEEEEEEEVEEEEYESSSSEEENSSEEEEGESDSGSDEGISDDSEGSDEDDD